jgi:hypothetical protein
VTDADSGEDGALDREAVDTVHDHLAATAERPVERTASRWLGEAEAVAADARAIDDEGVARERLAEVADLLANVEGTGDETADEHVRAARRLLDDLVGGDD